MIMQLQRRHQQAVGLTTDKAAAIFIATIVILLLATIFVGLRAWSAKLRRAPYRLDDYLVFLALVPISIIGNS